MQRIVPLLVVSAVVALSGCGNTWSGAKQDTRKNTGTVTNAVGTGLEKAGDGIEKAGEKVKETGK